MNSKFDALVSHPLGSPFAAQVCAACVEQQLATFLSTSFCFNERSKVALVVKLIPGEVGTSLMREFKRRAWIDPLSLHCEEYARYEILRMALVKSGFASKLGMSYQGLVDLVYQKHDAYTAKRLARLEGLPFVYCYEDGAFYTFKQAKARGVRCVYDLPIMHHRSVERILSLEAERFPELKNSLVGAKESDEKRARKDEELALADHIVVASTLTQQSLLEVGVPNDKISVIPYGAPEQFRPAVNPYAGPFRVIFVGRVGPRKGVHYLLKAWNKLKLTDASLELYGINEFPAGYLEANLGSAKYYRSLPHSELQAILQKSSLLVLPSLVEGFGLVLLEAMACGIPVIASTRTAAFDIISQGVEGFVIPPSDEVAIQEKIEWCFTHPEELRQMGLNAQKRAEHCSWQRYRESIMSLLRHFGARKSA